MSYLVEPMQLNFLNNKDRENIYRMNSNLDESFHLKYTSPTRIKYIIKDVKKQRLQKKEELLWASLVNEQDDNISKYVDNANVISGITNEKRSMRYPEQIDKELKRLKEDTRPERTSGVSKRFSVPGVHRSKTQRIEKSARMIGRTEDSQIGSSVASSATGELESPLSTERSPVSKLRYSVRKSHSDRTVCENSECNEETYSDSNCCTLLSNDYEINGEDLYDVRLHPFVAHKILLVQKKISNLLDEISYRLSNIPLPDGDQEMRRRQQCVMEFAVRFSRNYLYDLGRQIAGIKRHVRAISPNAREKPSHRTFSLHVQAIEQKLTSAHQLLLQALNAYCKHIPTSVLKGHPGKIREILQIVVDIGDICTKLNLTKDYFEDGDVEPPPLGKDTRNRCDLILSKLGLNSDTESQIFNRTVQSTPVDTVRNKTNEKSKNLPPRLSMYCASTVMPSKKKHRNRKDVRNCTSGRRLSNTVRSIPQRYHLTTPEPQPSSVPKRDRPKIRLPPKEDEINTVISILPTDSATSIVTLKNSARTVSIREESVSRRSSSKNSSTNIAKLSNVRMKNDSVEKEKKSTNESNPSTDNELSNLVPVIANLMNFVKNKEKNNVEIRPVSSDSIRVLTDILRKFRDSINGENSTMEQVFNKSEIEVDEQPQNSGSSLTELRVGPKNMQLICLPPVEKSRHKTDERRDSPVDKISVDENSKRVLKIDESSRTALLKYREDYYEWSRTNPMYTSKSKNKPWEVVAWIADKLSDELVVDVAKELQIPNFIENMFEMEFNKF